MMTFMRNLSTSLYISECLNHKMLIDFTSHIFHNEKVGNNTMLLTQLYAGDEHTRTRGNVN